MFIRKLQLTNFKNHEKKDFLFKEQLVAFVGKNGLGKTNILDAIYFLCIGKSYFSSLDKQTVKHGEHFLRIVMRIEKLEEDEVVLILEQNKKKQILVNELTYEKLSDHLGVYPVVIVAPNDNMIILGGAEERRRFIDQSLAQLSQEYLGALMKYNSILKQRNALLKMSEFGKINHNLLNIYNQELSSSARVIYEHRSLFAQDLLPFFKQSYQVLAGKEENYTIVYKSDLHAGNLKEQLDRSLEKDMFLARTSKGIHRDDFIFKIEEDSLKDFASQGQQKTFLLALKLSQFNFLKAQLNEVPLFIIDDIFDKLDKVRSQNLIQFLAKQKAQVFISHTSKDIFQELIDVPIQIIELRDGEE